MDRPSRNRKAVNYSDFQDDDDEDFACVKPPPKKARTIFKDPDSERSQRITSASQNHVVVDLTGSGNRKSLSLDDKMYESDLEAALTLSLLDASEKEEEECATRTDDHFKSEPLQSSPPVLTHCSADGKNLGLVSRSPGASQNAVVKSPGQGLRLGLSRLARVKPLHPNAAAH